MKRILFILITVILLLLSSGVMLTTSAAPAAQFGSPTVVINTPPSNSTFPSGQTILIQSTSSASAGISFVQLFVDGALIDTDSTPNGQPQPTFSLVQYWTTTPGTHTITVRATNVRGSQGQASIVLFISGTPFNPTPTPVGPCVVSMQFVRDVTILDNSIVPPGITFTKTWQVLNNGSCTWGPGYGLVNVGGGTLGAPSPSGVPNTLPGQTVNLSVTMVSPTTPGTYRSEWQLRASNGAFFGPRLHVQIIVPGAPTPVPTPVGCIGAPQITSFYANPPSIYAGQSTSLVWGAVFNFDYVKLQTPLGSSGVNAPGQLPVSPSVTTTYILTAFCKGTRADAATTISVGNPQPPTPVPGYTTLNIAGIQTIDFGRIRVSMQYYWIGDGAPAFIQANALDAFGNVLATANSGGLTPYSYQITSLTLNIPGGAARANRVSACIYDRSSNALACTNSAMPR